METTNSLKGNDVGNKIRKLRIAKDWSQSELATRLSISIPAVSKIEAGLTTINITRLKQLAEILDSSVDYFLVADPNRISTQGLQEIERLQLELDKKNQLITKLQDVAIQLHEDIRSKRTKKKPRLS